jgi:hypothetical protein
MNPFTTDHPLASSKPSWFDSREHPRLSFISNTAVLGLILTPFVLYRLYIYTVSDIGAEPNPFPEPWRALFAGTLIAFAFSVLCAIPVVSLYRFISRKRRMRKMRCYGIGVPHSH